MRSCYATDESRCLPDARNERIAYGCAFPFLAVFGFIFLGIGIRDYLVNGSVADLVCSIAFFVFFCYTIHCILMRSASRYRVQQDGLLISFGWHKPKLIPWDAFQEVCVCRADYPTRPPLRYSTVICCIRKGEKKNLYGRWKTNNPFHYRSVIRIAYTEERHQEFLDICPVEIKDFRDSRLYPTE